MKNLFKYLFMTILGGFVNRPRCIINSKVATATPCTREVWDLIIREANHKNAKYRGWEIKRGQLFRSYDDLREKLHWYKGWETIMYEPYQIKNAMRYLRDNGMITTKRAPGGVLITICKYDYYQTAKNYENTKESSEDSTIETPSEHDQGTTINKNEENVKNVKNEKKKYLSEITDSDPLDKYLQIAFDFWKQIKENLKELNIKLDYLKEAEIEPWTVPIKQLIEKHKKTKDEIDEVYQFIPTNKFWKEKLYHTKQFVKKNENGILFFDTVLMQKRKVDVDNSLPNKEELELALKLSFKNPKDHFIKLFHEYQIMCRDANLKIFKGKLLDSEINNLAKQSGYDNMAAVNLLRTAVSKRKELDKFKYK